MHLFMAVPMTISAAVAVTSAAIYSFAERTDLCRQYSLLPEEKFNGGVIETGDKMFPCCH